jgi:hypothetical protein
MKSIRLALIARKMVRHVGTGKGSVHRFSKIAFSMIAVGAALGIAGGATLGGIFDVLGAGAAWAYSKTVSADEVAQYACQRQGQDGGFTVVLMDRATGEAACPDALYKVEHTGPKSLRLVRPS